MTGLLMYNFDFTYGIHSNSIFPLCLHFVLLMSHVWFSVVLTLFCLLVYLVSFPVCLFGFHQRSWLVHLNVYDHQGKFKIHIIIYLFCSHSCTVQFLCFTNSLNDHLVTIRCPEVLIGTGELLQPYCSNLAKGLHHPRITLPSHGSSLFYM